MKGGLACRDDGLAMVDLTGSRAIGWMEDSSALGVGSGSSDSFWLAQRLSPVFWPQPMPWCEMLPRGLARRSLSST